MGYIMEMRKFVGHRTILSCGAGILLEDAHGRVLLQERADTGMWGYPGGAVEPDETVEAAANRELWEEMGLKAKHLDWFGVFSGPELHNIYPNGDEVSVVDCVFLCREWSGELRLQEAEVISARFFSPDELPGNLFPPHRPALRKWSGKFGE